MNFLELKAAYVAGTLDKADYIRAALDEHRRLFDYVDVVRATDLREISITATGVSFVVGEPQICLVCPPDEARVAPIEIMNFDRYEPEETRVLAALLGRCEVILDVGANIGWYAIWLAKMCPQAQVHAFEPIPASHAYLQRNIALNSVGQRVFAYNYGLSDTCGVVDYFVSPTSGTNASLRNVADADSARSLRGLAMTLDQWVANNDASPDLIKCDVEGAEFLVFKGARDTLSRCRPIVFCEMLRKWARPFGYHPNDVIAFFEALGYACLAIGGAGGVRRLTQVTEETVETNYVFLHADHHRELLEQLVGGA